MSPRKHIACKTLVADRIVAKKIRVERLEANDSLESKTWNVPEKLQQLLDLDASELKTTLLRNADFEKGTYRIRKPGRYVLTEDIEFNPGQPDFSEYPQDKYKLGFFAAITIESSHVVLDGQYHTIRQSRAHYLQQRFFSCVELADQPFVPKQGPDPMGVRILSATHCRIQNLSLGLSSHHGIHGNLNKFVVLRNVSVTDFEIAGIALNGAQNVYLRDVVVGGSHTKVPVLATYSHARFMEPFWLRVNLNQTVEINGEQVSGESIRTSLQKAMDRTFEEYTQTGQVTQEKLFVNAAGVSDGNQYGIVFHNHGVAVHGLLEKRQESLNNSNLFLECVSVGGLRCRFQEVPSLPAPSSFSAYAQVQSTVAGAVFRFPLKGPYVRNALLDAMIFLYSQGFGNLTSETLAWAAGKTEKLEYRDQIRTNLDSMAHTAKGSIGLFLNGAYRVFVHNLDISDIRNDGPSQIAENSALVLRGTDVSGMVMAACEKVALGNVKIRNLFSENGKAVGVFSSNTTHTKQNNLTVTGKLNGSFAVIRDVKI